MEETESLRKWFAYSMMAERGYLETFAKLPSAELARPRGASYPTLLEILKHSLDGTSSWIERLSAINGEVLTQYKCPDQPTLADLREYHEATELQIQEFFRRVRPTDLDRDFLVPKLPPWWDDDFQAPVRGTLLHIIEHELQHRGELNALLWQIDVEPPILDWVSFEEAQESSRQP
jgi:uncharacterized damage-inducible protein DinB